MSVAHFLRQRFPPDVVCPVSLWDELVALPSSQATSYAVYSGHFFGHLDRFLGKPTTKFTLLRDPVERTVSHFRHVRRDPRHPFYERCRAQTLLDFVTAPETRYMAQDLQARYLSTAGEDIRAVAQGFSSTELQEFRLQTSLEAWPLPHSRKLYKHGCAALNSFMFVGVSERFDEAMERLAQLLELPPHLPFAPQNKASSEDKPVELDSPTREAILAATAVDRALYERALEVQQRSEK